MAPAFPTLTACVTAVTAAVSITGLLAEPVLLALRRDAAAVSGGQYWRLLTAMLVQDGGVAGTVFNLLGLLLVGIAAERTLRTGGWLVAYLVGGLTGELTGWAGWQPIGAGNSVGVCGLAGGMAVVLLRTGSPPGRLAVIAPATWAASLISATLPGVAPALAAIAAGLAVTRAPRASRWVPLVVVVASAVLLMVQRDIHGAALAGGLVTGILLPARGPTDETVPG